MGHGLRMALPVSAARRTMAACYSGRARRDCEIYESIHHGFTSTGRTSVLAPDQSHFRHSRLRGLPENLPAATITRCMENALRPPLLLAAPCESGAPRKMYS